MVILDEHERWSYYGPFVDHFCVILRIGCLISRSTKKDHNTSPYIKDCKMISFKITLWVEFDYFDQ